MPSDSEEEDWYERRKRLDAEERLEDHERRNTALQRPLLLARNQAFAIAGVSADYDDVNEPTYRPAPEGKSVRLPFSSRPLYRPMDLPTQPGIADHLVREALQPSLGRYMDPQVVEVARRELAEAYELDDRQLDSAAYALTYPSYLEHVGGLHPDEINDINQYSRR